MTSKKHTELSRILPQGHEGHKLLNLLELEEERLLKLYTFMAHRVSNLIHHSPVKKLIADQKIENEIKMNKVVSILKGRDSRLNSNLSELFDQSFF